MDFYLGTVCSNYFYFTSSNIGNIEDVFPTQLPLTLNTDPSVKNSNKPWRPKLKWNEVTRFFLIQSCALAILL